jgi:hypothetical protein
MARYRYDRDLDSLVPVGNNYFVTEPQGPYIIPDILGYQTIACDVANNGNKSYISSRSRHREFLRDNNLVEVGNDYDAGQVAGSPRRETRERFQALQRQRVEAIKMAIDLVRTGRVAERFDVRRRESD